MDRNVPHGRTLAVDPLATPEELRPQSGLTDGASASNGTVPARQSDTLTIAQGADVPTEDHASEDFARPVRPAEHGPLLNTEETGDLRTQWDAVQTDFVDDPRNAVKRADHLVALALQRLMSTFNAERARLEGQWDRGGEVSTEDLRIALQRYRSFFHRLLAV